MKIVKLHAENYKRLRAVEIAPTGDVVTITGRNAQGKTSVLDAIWAALAGREASRATSQPIRAGEKHAVVRLDLGDYIVTRRWARDDSGTLTIEAPDGARYSSPQKLLDEVIGAHAFDPLAFTRMTAREQVAALVAAVELPFDPDALERERKGVFARRTDVNRDVARLDGQLAGFAPADESLPDREVSAAELLAEVDAAREHNAEIVRARERVAKVGATIDDLSRRIAEMTEDLHRQSVELAHADQALVDLGAERDISEATARLTELEATNARIREQQRRREVEAELASRKADAEALTGALDEIERRKADALAAVQFPVEGLSFDESGVTYRGVPFSQASGAEQLRVSVALAMAANPTLRVLRVTDGSLLDAESMQVIRDLAAEADYQVWVEVVGDGSTGIVIEDGQVAA